jgi:tetratricopeptide (TPR) repeat protein
MNSAPIPTGNAGGPSSKPRLVFFQYKYDDRLPSFLLMHKREHAQCLSQFFDVTVITEDSDYGRICDTYRPDLVLFESGVPNPACRRLEITNTKAHANIPKLGFLHADGFCCARAGFLSDMDQWGIQTFFAIATTAGEHIPTIADNLFIWPNFADPTIYRDYGQTKNIPVLFTGNSNSIYPWRQQIMKLVSSRYPSMMCPHPGYAAGRSVGAQFTIGEPYARMINASWCVPACGAVARELVRKHLEVPASKSCLVTEKSAALEAAGFIDMTNCVFADAANVLDKLEYLFSNPDKFSAIIDAGHELVHSRHTIQHRDQVFQWFKLHRELKAGDKIMQDGPFKPLRIAEDLPGNRNAHVRCGGVHLTALAEGDQKLLEGKYQEAEKFYQKCAAYISYMPEPKLRLALAHLYMGNASKSLSYIQQPLQFTLAEYQANDPDPVEWAYFVVSLLCLGNLSEAAKRAAEFPWLRHPELDRVRWALSVLTNADAQPLPVKGAANPRPDIHHLPARGFTEWIEQLRVMLTACGQQKLANALTAGASKCDAPARFKGGSISDRKVRNKSSLTVARSDAHGSFRRRLLYSRAKTRSRSFFATILRRLEGEWGYFLPYRLSTAKRDEFYGVVEDLARETDIKTALIVGATTGKHSTEALLSGALENENSPAVFCVSIPKKSLPVMPSHQRSARETWLAVNITSERPLSEEIEKRLAEIKHNNGVTSFDLVLIEGSALESIVNTDSIQDELRNANLILLDNLNSTFNFEIYSELAKDPTFVLSAHNPDLRNGYSIFRKSDPSPEQRGASCSAPVAAR